MGEYFHAAPTKGTVTARARALMESEYLLRALIRILRFRSRLIDRQAPRPLFILAAVATIVAFNREFKSPN